MITELDYISGKSILQPTQVGISPSQLERFFSEPHKWYRTEVLNEQGFAGSTSSMLGTIIHYVARCYARDKHVKKEEIYKYLYRELVSDKSIPAPDFSNYDEAEEFLYTHADHPVISCSEILEQFRPMGNAVITYLKQRGSPQRTEELISAPIIDNHFICGSCDAVRYNRTIIDYKTTSDKTTKDYIPYGYKLQLLSYAYIYRSMGLPIDSISIVWITRHDVNRYGKNGKALQDYPSTVTEVTQQITSDDWIFIESILKLVAETLQTATLHPELVYLLFKDYRLKL